jgi:hypothetical protein
MNVRLSGAFSVLLSSDGSYDTQTDQSGRFEMQVPVGTYDALTACAPGFVDYPGAMGAGFEVNGPLGGLRLQLMRGGRVEGAVRTAQGSLPPPGTRAELRLPAGESAGTSMAAEVSPQTGRFLFERVRPGPAELRIYFPADAMAVARFEVAEGQVAEPVLRHLAQARITGTLLDARDGTPLSMATVTALGETAQETRITVTGDDGTFELPPMTAGRIVVLASQPGYASAHQTLDASDGGSHDVTIKTSPGGRIEGSLAPGTAFQRAAALEVTLMREAHAVATAYPDADGRFVMSHVVPGRYTVTLTSPADTLPGAPTARALQITVAEGQTTRVVLEAR